MVFFKILVLLLLVCIPLAIGYRSGIGWCSGRGQSWGRTHFKELGLDEDKPDHRE